MLQSACLAHLNWTTLFRQNRCTATEAVTSILLAFFFFHRYLLEHANIVSRSLAFFFGARPEHCCRSSASGCTCDILLRVSITEILVILLPPFTGDMATCRPCPSPSVCTHVFVILMKFLLYSTAIFFPIACRPMHYWYYNLGGPLFHANNVFSNVVAIILFLDY